MGFKQRFHETPNKATLCRLAEKRNRDLPMSPNLKVNRHRYSLSLRQTHRSGTSPNPQ